MDGGTACLERLQALRSRLGTMVRHVSVDALLDGRWRSLRLLCLAVACSLLLLSQSSKAFGETDPAAAIEGIDELQEVEELQETEELQVLDVGETWPSETIEESLVAKRVDGGMVLATKSTLGVTSVVAVAVDPAGAAWSVFTEITSYVLNKQQALYIMTKDLAWRWYHADETKRAKVPVIPSNDSLYTPLSNETFTGAGDSQQQYEKWENYYTQFWPLSTAYVLAKYDGDGTWVPSGSATNIEDYQEYAKWYEWFEGSSSGGESGDSGLAGQYYVYPVDHIVNQTAYDNLGEERCEWVAVSKEVIDEILSYNSDFYLTYAYAGNYSTSEKHWFTGFTSRPLAYVREPNQYDFGDATVTATHGYTGTVTKVFVNDTQLGQGVIVDIRNYQGGNYNYSTIYWTNRNPSYAYDTVAYFTGRLDSGELIIYDPNNSDPVYPVYPEPDTPSNPTINAPTYIDNSTTTTTVDLQPILEAIRALNTNLVTGFETLKSEIDGWMDSIAGWLELIWKELRSANRWLEGIFYKTGGGSASEPDISTDDDGWWGWLAGIAELLLGDLAGAVSGLSGAFDALHTLFPFSVPWDLAALLALFVSEPVTPVFDLPVPFGYANGALQSASVHIDLSAWDNVMVAVRSVELVIFAAGLAFKTRDLLRNAEVEQ